MIKQVPLEHSADVVIRLTAAGREFDVAKLRSDRCVVRDPIDLVPCEATLAIMIDGQETIETVYLRNGMSQHDPYVAFF